MLRPHPRHWSPELVLRRVWGRNVPPPTLSKPHWWTAWTFLGNRMRQRRLMRIAERAKLSSFLARLKVIAESLNDI